MLCGFVQSSLSCYTNDCTMNIRKMLLIAFLILRPALKSALNPPLQVSAIPPVALGGAGASAGSQAGQGATSNAVGAAQAEPMKPQLPPMEQKLGLVRDAVNQDPKKVAQLMKQWVGDE